jgi:nucleoside-diphosphate-sugar epimerase
VSGFIHLAVDLSFAFSAVPDPKASIASAIDMTLGILKSALQVPSMRAAVVCSSIAAMYHPEAGKAVHPSNTEYNDLAIKLAHSLPDDHPFKGPATYMASKTEAEKGLWSWVSDVKVSPRHVPPGSG